MSEKLLMEIKRNIVIDTNILISAVIFPNSVTAKVVRKALINFEVCISEATLKELISVLQRPKFDKYFIQRPTAREQFITDFRQFAVLIEVTETITDCNDPKDNKFLEVAIACEAIYLVTGDKKDLISMNPYRNIEIITASEFLTR